MKTAGRLNQIARTLDKTGDSQCFDANKYYRQQIRSVFTAQGKKVSISTGLFISTTNSTVIDKVFKVTLVKCNHNSKLDECFKCKH